MILGLSLLEKLGNHHMTATVLVRRKVQLKQTNKELEIYIRMTRIKNMYIISVFLQA
jgi:hypothetical protein